MYQVTALYMDCELAYGEGESVPFAVEDCIDSIPDMYKELAEDVMIRVIGESGMMLVSNLSFYL
jgi:hypothetical protein